MGYLLIGPLVSGCFGGWVTLLVGSMSYISDVSTDINRTGRIAVAECAIALPISLSFLVSGIYLEKTNYQTVLSTTLVLYFVSIIYSLVWIGEPPGRKVWKDFCFLFFYKIKGKGKGRVYSQAPIDILCSLDFTVTSLLFLTHTLSHLTS